MLLRSTFCVGLLALAAAGEVTTDAAGDVEIQFGIHDFQVTPPGGWQLMSSQDFTKYSAAFVKSYNAKGGIKVLRAFDTGNCCFAVKGGKKLTIAGTQYDYQFPADTSGEIRCNPKGGYTDAYYGFFRTPTLPATPTFGEKTACSTDHNPGVFMKLPYVTIPFTTSRACLKFGIADVQSPPPGGWSLLSADELEKYKDLLIAHYNNNGGLQLIEPFESTSCCFAVRGGKKLTISGTPGAEHVFPAAASDQSMRCNPNAGYMDSKYQFYGAAKLAPSAKFGATNTACAGLGHNPAIYLNMCFDFESTATQTGAMRFGIFEIGRASCRERV